MKALIVGLGSAGVRHLNNLHALGVEKFLVLRKRMADPPAAVAAQDVQVFERFDQAQALGPDIAVVANPTALHLESAQKVLDAGCHLYLEKPVSHTAGGLDSLARQAARTKRIVTVGCQLRFHPNLLAIKKWITERQLGKVFTATVDMGEYLPSWHPWEDYRTGYAARSDLGGGVVLTQIHDIDYLYWLFGPMACVHADGGRLTPLETDVEDTAMISLRSNAGVRIHLRMDYWRNPPVRKMNVVGEKGEIFWDYHKGEAVLIRGGEVRAQSKLSDAWERNTMFLDIMKDFLEAVRTGAEPAVPLSQGIDTLNIALAAKAAMAKNRRDLS